MSTGAIAGSVIFGLVALAVLVVIERHRRTLRRYAALDFERGLRPGTTRRLRQSGSHYSQYEKDKEALKLSRREGQERFYPGRSRSR